MVQKCRFCNTIDKGTGICTSYAFGKQPVAAWNENRDHREKIYISYDSTNKNLPDDSGESSNGASSGAGADIIPLGLAKEQGTGTLTTDTYLNTELIKKQTKQQ